MSKEPDHIDPKLLKKYLEGEITGSEAHELEKRILENAFESEAMDGLAEIDPAAYAEDMESLEVRLNEKIEKMSTGPSRMYILRIAASVLLIAASAFLTWYFVQPNLLTDNSELSQQDTEEPAGDSIGDPPDSTSLAMAETAKEDDPELMTEAFSPESEPNREQVEVQGTEEIISPDDPILDSEAEIVETDLIEEKPLLTLSEGAGLKSIPDTTISVENTLTGAVSGLQVTKSEDNSADEEVVREEVADLEKRATSRSRLSQAAPSSIAQEPVQNTVSGKLTGESASDPLIGANVVVKGTSRGSTTDINGNFSIEADPGSTLVFTYIGYETNEVQISDQSELNISLDPDMTALSEVVVVGYGRKTTTQEIIATSAQPEGGYSALRDFIKENLVYPEEASENDISGRVVVLFTVNTNGTLSDFRVKRSLGYGCDEEAIRLIREGPAWIPSTENDQEIVDEVRVTVRFKE